jgi:F-box domain
MEDAPEQKRILTSLAYHWTEADRAVIRFPKSKSLEYSGLFTDGGMASMGRLTLLPLEVLHNILRELDFESLGTVRCLNTQSKDIVGMLPVHRDLATFAHDALRALSATGMLSKYSGKCLYFILCRDRCIGCTGFGSFLFLPTGCRCCFSCIETNPEMVVVSASTAAALFGLANEALRQITIITTVSGDYGISQKTHRKRIRIVSRQEARKVGILIHGSEEEMERAVALGIRRGNVPRENDRLPKVANRSIPQPPCANDTLRFMACTPFPYLNVQRRRIDKGVCCRGCEYNWHRRDEDFPSGYDVSQNLFRKQNKTFSENDFLVHFETCRSARLLWDDYILKGKELSESVRSTIFRT